jgi:superfamily II DNA or RNA helicase
LNKSAICYCVNVNHSKQVADAFNAAGIPAAHVDGDTDKKARSHFVRIFAQV